MNARAIALKVKVKRVEQDCAQPGILSAEHVVPVGVTDINGFVWRHIKFFERVMKNRGIRFSQANQMRINQ